MLVEEWKDIKGYEGLYRISNYGKILGVKRGKLLKHNKNVKNGYTYLTVGLHGVGCLKVRQVNRLVYQNFKGVINGRIEHLDGDVNNCSIENLIDVKKTFKYKNVRCKRVLDTITMKMYDSISDLAIYLGTTQNNLSARLEKGSNKYSHYKIIENV